MGHSQYRRKALAAIVKHSLEMVDQVRQEGAGANLHLERKGDRTIKIE
jgi:hypothetical protein